MKISVITPFYDGNAYMPHYQQMMIANEEQLLLYDRENGSDFSMEVILVNDSPGIVVAISALYKQKQNWRVVTNASNMGIHASRAEGLKQAAGEYVMFLDQDDELADDALLCFCLAAEKKKKPVYVSNANFETKDKTNLLYRTAYQKERVGDLQVYLCVGTQIVSPGQCVIRADAIPHEWKENLLSANGADDYFLWLLLLGKEMEFGYIDKPLYTHKYTGENISASTEKTDASVLEFLPLLQKSGAFEVEEISLLRRMITYKAAFRKGGAVTKILLSIKNFDIFFDNLIFKKRTKTPYGFNR